jgi:hypothetical protein
VTPTLSLVVTVALLGQASDDPAARLQVMKSAMASYRLRSPGDRLTTYRLQPEPVLRFTNTVGETRDGAIFLWTDIGGRPAAAVQVFERRNDGQWVEEFTSLSAVPLSAVSTSGHEWNPAEGGVELKPFPGAPKPAPTPEQRLVQMRALSREVTAEDHFRRLSWQPLRMLSKPFARYGQADSSPIDGALFAYVLTTDPEVYLILEARSGGDGPAWYFGFAPSTIYPLRAKLKGVEVWSLPYRPQPVSRDPTQTFHVHLFKPGE